MSSVLNLPLRSRLILLAVAAALITGAVTSAAAYFLVRGSEFAAADQRLGAAARLHSAKLRATLDLIRADAASIAAMPAVPGIIRSSTSADGTDAQERSDFALWQRRLETIFAAILSTRPAYTQLRYIGIADNWKELVRVNQSAEGPTAVRGDALQSKAAEPYLQHPDFLAAGRTLFSQVTYNREQGRRDGPPTLRFVQPVFDAQGQLFGVVVINADFAELLRSAGFDPTEGNRVHVLTDSGDHMSFGADAAPATLQFHEDAGWAPLALRRSRGKRGGPDGPGARRGLGGALGQHRRQPGRGAPDPEPSRGDAAQRDPCRGARRIAADRRRLGRPRPAGLGGRAECRGPSADRTARRRAP
jgi:hypothetical protein